MKNIFLLLAVITLATAFTLLDDIYSLSIITIDGKTVNLNAYKGVKLMFIILPVSEVDSSKINELQTFQNKYKGRVTIIGIPSIEEGFQKGNEKLISKLYKEDRKMDMIICEPSYSKKGSGVLQSAVFQWLTDKEKNKRFNDDVRGVGHKFFVDEVGRLYAVMGPETSLSSPVIEKIINKPYGK